MKVVVYLVLGIVLVIIGFFIWFFFFFIQVPELNISENSSVKGNLMAEF